MIRTPDAIQVATALASESSYLLTNDRGFERIKELNVLILDDFIEK